MERLTQRLRTGEVLMASNYEEKYTEQEWISVLQDRLAAYEDTGLMPGEFKSYWTFLEDLIGNQKASEALLFYRHLITAYKDGYAVVLPCKVGDKLYEVTGRKTISVYKVKAIRVELFSLFIEWDIVEGFVWQSLSGINAGEIGKTVFLTREEAEKALEAMKK